jgi:uncharacterized membrane protein (DUF485 family)
MSKTKTDQRQFFARAKIIFLLVFAFSVAIGFKWSFVGSSIQAQQAITGEWLIDFNRKIQTKFISRLLAEIRLRETAPDRATTSPSLKYKD